MRSRRMAQQFKLPNLSLTRETKAKAITGAAIREKYAIREFLCGPSYGEGLAFAIRRPFTSNDCEVMLCVVLHSASPEIRDIVDVEDYV